MWFLFFCLNVMATSNESLLQEIDNFLGPANFEASFKSPQEIAVKNESCLSSSCDGSFLTFDRITEASNDSIKIGSFGTDGKLFAERTLTKDLWHSRQGNRARFHLEQMQSSGFTAEIESVEKETHKVVVNGTLNSFEMLRVRISGKNAIGMKPQHQLLICRDCGGLGQVWMREQKDLGSSTSRYTVEEIRTHQ